MAKCRLNRALANWYCDPFDRPYHAALIRDSRRAPETRPALESRRGVACRGHRASARYTGSARQGGRDPAGVRGCHDPCHRSSACASTGANRLVLTGGVALNAVGNMRLLEHFDEAWFAQKFQQRKARLASVGAPDAGRPWHHHRRRLACSRIWLARRAASPMSHAFYCGTPPSPDDIAAGAQSRRYRLAADGEYLERSDGRDAIADLMAFMIARKTASSRSIKARPKPARARSAIARSWPIRAIREVRVSGSTNVSNTARRSARWRRWRRWKPHWNISTLLEGACGCRLQRLQLHGADSAIEAIGARQNSGGDPCRRHRPNSDRAGGRRSPHLRVSEGRWDVTSASRSPSTPRSTSPARSRRPRNQAIDTLRRSRGLDVVLLVAR